MKHEKTQARLSVERVLSEATEPLKAQEVADRAGIGLALARHYIGRLMNLMLIHSTGARRSTAYRWGMPPASKPMAEQREPIKFVPYVAGSQFPVRAGSMDAYSIPSLHEGRRIERRPPIIIGAPMLEVPWKGLRG